MDTTFKLANNESIPELLDMMAAFYAIDQYPFYPGITRKNLQEFLNDQELGRLWMIVHNTEIIGYIAVTFGFSFEYHGRDAFIDEFFIKKDYRNKGIGQKTMEFIESQAFDLGITAIHLEVERHNEKAKKMYIRRGFRGNDRILLTKKIT